MSDTQPDPVLAESAAPADPVAEEPAAGAPAAEAPAEAAALAEQLAAERVTPAPVPGPWLVFEADADTRSAILAISRAIGLGRHTTSL